MRHGAWGLLRGLLLALVTAALAAPVRAQSPLWSQVGTTAQFEVSAAGDLLCLSLHDYHPWIRIYRVGDGFSAPVGEQVVSFWGALDVEAALGPDHALVGEPRWGPGSSIDRGRVHVLRRAPTTGTWSTVQVLASPLTGAVRFGSRVAVDGDRALIATRPSPSGGQPAHVYAYLRDPATGTWTLEQDLVPSYAAQTNAGASLALDGDVAVLGDPVQLLPQPLGQGRAGVWRRGPTGMWTEEAWLDPPTPAPNFGRVVAVSGDDVVVADRYDGLSGLAPTTGAAHHYRRVAGAWVPGQVLAHATGDGPEHPHAVALEGDTLVLSDDGTLPVSDGEQEVWVLRRAGPGAPFVLGVRFGDDVTGSSSCVFGHALALEGGRLWVGERSLGLQSPHAYLLNPDDARCDGVNWDSDRVVAGEPDLDHDAVPDACQALGTVGCTPGPAYVLGAPVGLEALGSPVVGQDDLDLVVLDGPAGAFGYALASSATAHLPYPGGSAGLLCLRPGPDLVRLVDTLTGLDAQGSALLPVDLATLPDGQGGTGPPPGSTVHFQFWFRVGATSAFSNSLSIDFQ